MLEEVSLFQKPMPGPVSLSPYAALDQSGAFNYFTGTNCVCLHATMLPTMMIMN